MTRASWALTAQVGGMNDKDQTNLSGIKGLQLPGRSLAHSDTPLLPLLGYPSCRPRAREANQRSRSHVAPTGRQRPSGNRPHFSSAGSGSGVLPPPPLPSRQSCGLRVTGGAITGGTTARQVWWPLRGPAAHLGSPPWPGGAVGEAGGHGQEQRCGQPYPGPGGWSRCHLGRSSRRTSGRFLRGAGHGGMKKETKHKHGRIHGEATVDSHQLTGVHPGH